MLIKEQKQYGEKVCLYCGTPFIAATANQVYCSPEHTRKASNDKIIERYHAKKQAKTKDRLCDGCGSKLSRYNEDPTCNPCQQKKKESDRIAFLRSIGFSYESE